MIPSRLRLTSEILVTGDRTGEILRKLNDSENADQLIHARVLKKRRSQMDTSLSQFVAAVDF